MTDRQRGCEHRIAAGSVTEADGGHDPLHGTTIVDVHCRRCGLAGSAKLIPSDVNWEEDEQPARSPDEILNTRR